MSYHVHRAKTILSVATADSNKTRPQAYVYYVLFFDEYGHIRLYPTLAHIVYAADIDKIQTMQYFIGVKTGCLENQSACNLEGVSVSA